MLCWLFLDHFESFYVKWSNDQISFVVLFAANEWRLSDYCRKNILFIQPLSSQIGYPKNLHSLTFQINIWLNSLLLWSKLFKLPSSGDKITWFSAIIQFLQCFFDSFYLFQSDTNCLQVRRRLLLSALMRHHIKIKSYQWRICWTLPRQEF